MGQQHTTQDGGVTERSLKAQPSCLWCGQRSRSRNKQHTITRHCVCVCERDRNLRCTTRSMSRIELLCKATTTPKCTSPSDPQTTHPSRWSRVPQEVSSVQGTHFRCTPNRQIFLGQFGNKDGPFTKTTKRVFPTTVRIAWSDPRRSTRNFHGFWFSGA